MYKSIIGYIGSYFVGAVATQTFVMSNFESETNGAFEALSSIFWPIYAPFCIYKKIDEKRI